MVSLNESSNMLDIYCAAICLSIVDRNFTLNFTSHNISSYCMMYDMIYDDWYLIWSSRPHVMMYDMMIMYA